MYAVLATVAVPDITTVKVVVLLAVTAALRTEVPLFTLVPGDKMIDFGAAPNALLKVITT